MLPLYRQDGCRAPQTNFLYLSIGALVAETAFVGYLNYRQLRCLRKTDLPKELVHQVSIVDKEAAAKRTKDADNKSLLQQLKEKFENSRLYNLDKNSFSLVSSLYSLTVGLALVGTGYQPWAWDIATSMASSWFGVTSEIGIATLFTLGTGLVDAILDIPMSVYNTFVLEEKHGFNKTTPRRFVLDNILGFAVMGAIVTPINAAITYLVTWGGDQFYWYCWLFAGAAQVSLMILAPTLIMPLFNKYKPLPDGQLKDDINKLAKSLDYPLQKLEMIDGSTRSSHSNAFLYGFWNSKKIVLFDTLITNSKEPALECSTDEIVAIIGHELGHWKLSHTIKAFYFQQAFNFCVFRSFNWLVHNVDAYTSFGFKDQPVIVGFGIFKILSAPIGNLVKLLLNSFTRYNEFEADDFAVQLGKASALKTGLVKLSLSNLASFNTDPLYQAFHHSHPSLAERLAAIDVSMRKAQ